MRYRRAGKQKRHLFGEYPSVSLAEARKRARRAQAALDDGRDLAAVRQAEKVAKTDTLAVLAADYLEKHPKKFERTAKEDERILNVDVLPRWKDRSVRELRRRDVRMLVDRVAKRAPVTRFSNALVSAASGRSTENIASRTNRSTDALDRSSALSSSATIRHAELSEIAALEKIPASLRRVSDLALKQGRARVAAAADPERAALLTAVTRDTQRDSFESLSLPVPDSPFPVKGK